MRSFPRPPWLRLALALAALTAFLAAPASAIDEGPKIDISYSPTSPVAGQPVVISNTGRHTCGQQISCTWSGQGGVGGTSNTITHTFTKAGTYTVQLEAVSGRGDDDGDDDDDKDRAVERVRIQVRPAATTTPPPTTPPPATQPPTTQTPPSTTPTPTTPAPSAGNPAPVAGFSVVTASATASFTSQATDANGDALDHLWSFGDGATSTARNPTHTYAADGTYTVTLRVTEQRTGGATATATTTVDVRRGTTTTTAVTSPGATTAAPPTTGSSTAVRPVVLRISPFPRVRISGRFVGRRTRLTRLAVSGPRGVRVSVRCRGRGCGRNVVIRLRSTGTRRVRAFERRLLRSGTVLEVRVTQAGRVGKYVRLRLRARRAPVRVDACVSPRGAIFRC